MPPYSTIVPVRCILGCRDRVCAVAKGGGVAVAPMWRGREGRAGARPAPTKRGDEVERSRRFGKRVGPARPAYSLPTAPASIRIVVTQAMSEGHPEDLDFVGESPVFDVVEVVLDPLGEAGVAAPAVDLRPAGHAGADAVAQHVLRKLLLEFSDELRPLRAGPDEGHLPPQDIDELRQLVQAPSPQVPPDPRAARVLRARPGRA